MKRLLVLPVLMLFLVALLARAEGPDALYVRIFSLIQEGDRLASTGQPDLARARYAEAQQQLKQLQKGYPNWNDTVVRFRLNYLSDRVGPDRAGAPSPSTDAPAPMKGLPAAPPGRTLGTDGEAQSLREVVHRLQQEKAVLEAKLKEALAARPAAVDPREFAKAEERIQILEKEKELLRVSLEQEQGKRMRQGGPASLEEMRKALADATKKLNAETERSTQLAREKQILETRLDSLGRDAELVKALKSENDNLRQQLAAAPARSQPPATPPTAPAATSVSSETNALEIARLQLAMKALQDEKEELAKTKTQLEAKLASVGAKGLGTGVSESDRLKQVEKERDELLKKLNENARQLYDNKARAESLQGVQADNQLEILRARLEVFEARKVPYTAEELALFKEPDFLTTKPDAKAGKKSLRELPRGAAPLLAEAERAFAARRFDEAEEKYREVLRLDDRSSFTLANLAACQLEQNRLADAEANLKRAVEYDPNDAYPLSLLGILRFKQENFDEALDLLSRSAQLDPQNPETQNYLGISLSQKGQRVPAETALRRAIQLAPGYGGAHHNLAVVYATQQPPFTALARWHYQKALASGHPQNADLEKLIEGAARPQQ